MFTMGSRLLAAAPLMGGLYAKGKKDAADKKDQEDLDDKIKQGYKNPGNEGRRKAAMPPESEDDSPKSNANIFTKEKRMPPSPREMASGGKVSSASKRGDGCITKGKTKGKMITMKGGGYAC
jgi:hypothetical protein|tara:strand:+ start:1046 stop:1411 length:366 start_codon:yes stop_codon:yes gene_type:complete